MFHSIAPYCCISLSLDCLDSYLFMQKQYLPILILILALLPVGNTLEVQSPSQRAGEVESAIWNYQSASTGEVYLLIGGKKFKIITDTCVKRICLDGAPTIVDYRIIDDIPSGDCDISQNAQLGAAKGGDYVYLLTYGQKWRITATQHFVNYGFDQNKIAYFQPAEMDLFKTGRDI